MLEDAEICTKTGKLPMTKAILNHILECNEFASCHQRVKAFRLYGEYLMQSNTESFDSVLTSYFNGSIVLLDTLNKRSDEIKQKYPNIYDIEKLQEFDGKYRKEAYEVIAKYADREYVQV